MIKKAVLISCLFFASIMIVAAQEAKLYDPKIDATAQIKTAVGLAQKQHKNILLQIGGNWCTWCLAFNKLVTTNPTLDSVLKADYIVEHINYSKENKNATVMKSLGFPNRFGFPVFVILDEKGNRIHTQNSAYLETADGKVGHDVNKVKEFLEAWSPKALDPKIYEASLK